ncbi:MAG TPA: biotin-dependent carboxyltransferase family protein [Candidatus Aquilonibacter sp.]|nr:biotin-dependent carboxyltransferase family protein [Candidatus Aquilonibacter sp.]
MGRTIEVEAPGLLTTVQDLGRDGFGPIGVSPSGAADPIALRLGNRLVGNPEGAAGIEMTLVGGAFRFPDGAGVALAGSDFSAAIDGTALDPWTSVEAEPGQTLRLGATRSGARCYLCIGGGIVVPPFFESASTHLLSGLGGFEGRALRKGDILEIGAANAPFRKRAVNPQFASAISSRGVLRVTPGPQENWFSETTRHAFYAALYRVGEASNRMGLRLEGTAISQTEPTQHMITEGVSLGAIQAPPSGLPIILFVEQQTTGGYPVVANVISADLHRIGQLRPRDEVRFEEVTFEAARRVLIEQAESLRFKELISE